MRAGDPIKADGEPLNGAAIGIVTMNKPPRGWIRYRSGLFLLHFDRSGESSRRQLAVIRFATYQIDGRLARLHGLCDGALREVARS